ncbi:hypothetical protein PHMEG_0008733 [Phytophthora megakarya]|uniref:Uncharacterized protein n=1 Tax=Phytophthora megakarya TaxID=4795 RepID=A0A225WJN4_9STRA|nr:hypothetical protein PHMEG_0008733 [Phytophthora megakarya]
MSYSIDLRWRDIVLMYLYSIDKAIVTSVPGYSERSLNLWYQQSRAAHEEALNLERVINIFQLRIVEASPVPTAQP